MKTYQTATTDCQKLVSMSLAKSLMKDYNRENYTIVAKSNNTEKNLVSLYRNDKIVYRTYYTCKIQPGHGLTLTSEKYVEKH